MSSVQSKAYWWHTCWFGGLPATVAPQLQAPDEAAALEREAPPVHDSSAILHSIGCRATVGRVKGEKLCFADAKGTRWPWDQLPLPSAVSRTLRLPMHSRASRWYLSLRLMGSSAHMHATCGRMSCGARPHMSAQPPQVLCCRIRLELHTQQNSEVQYDVRVCVCVWGGVISHLLLVQASNWLINWRQRRHNHTCLRHVASFQLPTRKKVQLLARI